MTGIRVVRYTTTPQAGDQNAQLVSAVYSALADRQPDGLGYATLRLEGDTFIHIARYEGESAEALTGLPAFAEFQRDLPARLSGAVDARSATVVGDFRLLNARPASRGR
jgi:hypothetical protein